MRARELRIEELLQVPGPGKLDAFGRVLEARGIAWEEAAFVGDDLADLMVMRRVGPPHRGGECRGGGQGGGDHVTAPKAGTGR